MPKANSEKLRYLPFAFSSIWAVIAGAIIGIAPIIYTNYIANPKLEGRIITIAIGALDEEGSTIISPRISTIDQTTVNSHNRITTLTTFLCISNKRNVPVPIVDYMLEMKYKNGAVRRCSPFYAKTQSYSLGFDKYKIKLPSNEQDLMNKVNVLVTPDKPLSGFIVFIDESDNRASDSYGPVDEAAITLFDGFGNSHKIVTSASDFRPPQLLRFLINGSEFTRR